MAVELEWRFDDEVPHEIPREGHPPRRPRRRMWPRLAGAALLLVGVGLYAWWRGRRELLALVEAEVQAVAQLELRALAKGDTELFLSLQDDTNPNWYQAQQTRATDDALMPPPLPGLTSTSVFTVENARVVGDAARVEVVRMAGLQGGEMAPFRAVRFYRRNDDGRWLHTRADPKHTGHVIVWSGQRIRIASFAADRTWMGPIASQLEGLAERFCSFAGIVPCQHRVPLTLDLTGTLDTAGEPEGILPAPLVVGAPDDEAARAAWEAGLRELLFERLIVREVGQSLASEQGWPRGGELFRARLHQWLRAEMGLREPISPDLELIGQALDTGDWIPVGTLWYFTFADDDDRRRLAEAELDLLLAFIKEEYGRSQIARPLHALRLTPRIEALIWQALGETWPIFELRYAAHVREVTGRPFEPLGEAPGFAEYDLVANCEGATSVWGLRLDRAEMAPLLAAAGFDLHSWSPDGTWLLVWRRATYGGGLYLLKADGTDVHQLTGIPEGAWIDGWSPDGGRLAYSMSGQLTGPEGGLVDVQADESVVAHGRSSAWSSDGSQLTYVTFRGGLPLVWLADGDGSNPRQVEEGHSVSWSPDGTQIAFISAESGLKITDVTTEETRTLLDSAMLYAPFDLKGERVFVSGNSLVWSPTGEWIGFAVSQFGGTKLVEGGVALIRPDGSDLRISFSREAGVALTGWSPDGHWLTSIITDKYDRARLTTAVIGIDGTVLIETDAAIAWSPDGRYLAVAEEDRLRIWEVGSTTWYSFEPPAHCGTMVWNPRGPLHEPTPGSGHVAPP